MAAQQQTLAQSVSFEGVGIHTGTRSKVTLRPAPENRGRVFLTSNSTEIPARVDFVVDCTRSVTLGRDDQVVQTPEHLLSALVANNIDNTIIEIEGVEIPILDGSAKEFFEGVRSAGVTVQEAPARIVTPQRIYSSHGNDGQVVLVTPWASPRYDYMLYYDHPMIGYQSVEFELSPDGYREQIAPARTFALWEEVQPLLEQGLAQGGGIENALVIFSDHYSSDLTVEDEPVKHKCLDLIGDFALLDARIHGRVLGVRAGHRLHVACANKLWEEMLVHGCS